MKPARFPKVDRNPPVGDPPLLAALRTYWLDKRCGRAMPSRHSIVPSEIKAQLPSILLVDVVENGRDFRYRLVGSRLHASFQSVPTGQLMSDMLEPFGTETVTRTLAAYREVVTSKVPSRLRGAGSVYSQGSKYFDSLLMPLSDDGESVNMIFGAFFFDWDLNSEYRDSDAALSRALAS